MKALVVFSGGMDSATALVQAIESKQYNEISTVTFNYGSKHNDREYQAAIKICEKYNVKNIRIDLSFMNEHFKSDLLKSGGDIPEGHYAAPSMKKTVVPFRNGIMLSIAVGLAESLEFDHVVIGNHFGDHAIYPDCRKTFIDPFIACASAGTYRKIEVVSPFCSIDKTGIARLGSALGVPFELTYSCYNGGDEHCGKCGTCVERIEAFKLADVTDPTQYVHSHGHS